MQIILSGEGVTDIGCAHMGVHGLCAPGQWTPGPMAHLADQIFENCMGYSMLGTCAYFLPETVLCTIGRTIGSRPRFRGTGMNIFHKRGAQALAALAIALGRRDRTPVTAIFFRDCDGTQTSPASRWETLYDSVAGNNGGFACLGLRTGVAMLPKPKSEAWLLCALRDPAYQHCEQLELASGNDNSPNSLKRQLEDCLQAYDCGILDLFSIGADRFIDSARIAMPSFRKFTDSFRDALRNTAGWHDITTDQSLLNQCAQDVAPFL